MAKKKFIITHRPFTWFFRKHWYSLYRWNNHYEYEGRTYRLIDFGAVTFGYSYKEESNG